MKKKPIFILLLQRMKMMSYLRSYQISNLHPDIKRQVKLICINSLYT